MKFIFKEKDPKRIKFFLANKILEKKECSFCGSTKNLQVDHIIPIHFFVRNKIRTKYQYQKVRRNLSHRANRAENLQWLCRQCNMKKWTDVNEEKLHEILPKRSILYYEKPIVFPKLNCVICKKEFFKKTPAKVCSRDCAIKRRDYKNVTKSLKRGITLAKRTLIVYENKLC